MDRHDQHHRPENQADDAQYMRIIKLYVGSPNESLAESIERAGTNIAKDNANRAHSKRGFPGFSVRLTVGWTLPLPC